MNHSNPNDSYEYHAFTASSPADMMRMVGLVTCVLICGVVAVNLFYTPDDRLIRCRNFVDGSTAIAESIRGNQVAVTHHRSDGTVAYSKQSTVEMTCTTTFGPGWYELHDDT